MMTTELNFAVVIPAYNEAATIRELAERALKQTDKLIIVNDGSSDDTAAQLEGLPLTLLNHSQNQGKAASLWSGICEAKKHNVDIIVTLDGDGQHAPEDIPLLLEKYRHNPNHIIIGARLADKSAIPAKRYYANRIANFWIAWAAGYPLSDSQSGFRIYPSHLFDNLRISTNKNDSFVFESEILIKAAQQHIYSQPVPIPAVYKENARPSHFHGTRDITLITIMVAKSLLRRALYLPGLYRSAIKPNLPRLPDCDGKPDYDGYFMLFLSSLIMLVSLGGSLLISWLYVMYIATSDIHRTAKKLLLLGKRLLKNRPDSDYLARLARTEAVLYQSQQCQVYILGGRTHGATISEAKAGQQYLIEHGIQQQQIILEETSRNTLENMRAILEHIDTQEDMLLVTNRYHMARSLTMAKGFNFKVFACPAEDKFAFTFDNLRKTAIEAFHLHWYLTGKVWAHLTQNQRMLKRISAPNG